MKWRNYKTKENNFLKRKIKLKNDLTVCYLKEICFAFEDKHTLKGKWEKNDILCKQKQ